MRCIEPSVETGLTSSDDCWRWAPTHRFTISTGIRSREIGRATSPARRLPTCWLKLATIEGDGRVDLARRALLPQTQVIEDAAIEIDGL